MGRMMKINRIATQGSGVSYWLKQYRLLYSPTGLGYKAYSMKNSTIMVSYFGFSCFRYMLTYHFNHVL